MVVLLAIAALITLLIGVVTLIFVSGRLEDTQDELGVAREAPRPISRKEERERAYQARLAAREAARIAEEKAQRIQEPSPEPSTPAEQRVLSAEEVKALLVEISKFIHDMGVVPVSFEKIAAEFELNGADEAVERVRQLVDDDLVCGVIDDDRGCFFPISEDVMNRVAALIRQQGRVAVADISDVAGACACVT